MCDHLLLRMVANPPSCHTTPTEDIMDITIYTVSQYLPTEPHQVGSASVAGQVVLCGHESQAPVAPRADVCAWACVLREFL